MVKNTLRTSIIKNLGMFVQSFLDCIDKLGYALHGMLGEYDFRNNDHHAKQEKQTKNIR